MMSFWPLIVAGERTLIGASRPARKKPSFFGPRTNAVTSNVSDAGFGPVTPASAVAVPVPTFEPFGHASGPLDESTASSHLVRPFALRRNVLGDVIVSLLSVRWWFSLTMLSSIDEF